MTLPGKLFIEVTSRCNLRCSMCVKQTEGSSIEDGDMSQETFSMLLPAMQRADAVILNGIGEPLLHPELESFIRQAKEHIPESGWVGFQSNGTLLTPARAESLLAAGVDRICLSVDSLEHGAFASLRQGGALATVEEGFDHLNQAGYLLGRDDFKTGIEFVAMRDNVRELPQVIEFAARKKVSFVIVTHLLPYSMDGSKKTLFSPNSDKAAAFFSLYRDRARRQGIDLNRYFEVLWRVHKNPEEERLVRFVADMHSEAQKQDISLNLKALLATDWEELEQTWKIFRLSEKYAREAGIELRLPAITARHDRRCDFVEDGSAFIGHDGTVHPCYFLWHRYSCFLDGETKFITPVSFGNVNEKPPAAIWTGDGFKKFREAVLRYDYPYCSDCSLTPCDDITCKNSDFNHDCYGMEVMCGHCPWCMGGFQCLR